MKKHDDTNPATWRWLAVRHYGSKVAHLHEWPIHGWARETSVCGRSVGGTAWESIARVDTVDYVDVCRVGDALDMCLRCRSAVLRDADQAYARRKAVKP